MTGKKEQAMEVVRWFAADFLREPHRCYTEHGIHALFFSHLLSKLSPHERFFDLRGRQVCVLQKEYPTATKLGRSKRQHWDVALAQPPNESSTDAYPMDSLRLELVFEFGLNEDAEHLHDDLERLSHPEANVEWPVAVHLQRLNQRAEMLSNRDRSPRSVKNLRLEDVVALQSQYPSVSVIFANVDFTGSSEAGVWEVSRRGVRSLADCARGV